jgi:hypothetical protein
MSKTVTIAVKTQRETFDEMCERGADEAELVDFFGAEVVERFDAERAEEFGQWLDAQDYHEGAPSLVVEDMDDIPDQPEGWGYRTCPSCGVVGPSNAPCQVITCPENQ